MLSLVKHARTDPAVLDWRIDIGCVRGRTGHAGKAKSSVGRPREGTGLLAVFHDTRVAQCEPRLIEGIEILEDQKCDRLAEIARRLAQRAEQVACVKFG